MGARKGIILAGGSGTRLYPLTLGVSKQLLAVYDKPMIYHPLSVLMLGGMRDTLVISTPEDLPLFRRLLGDGSDFGIELSYAEQPRPDGLAQALTIAEDVGFLGTEPVALALGDNIFFGNEFVGSVLEASSREEGATIFGYRVSNPSSYGVVELSDGRPVSIEEKPARPKSDYAVPGLYFYDERAAELARSLKPSARGELEITDLNRLYMEMGRLHVEILGRGTAWFDAGTHDDLMEAGQFVSAIEKRQGLKIACLEEIAFRNGWMDRPSLERRISLLGKSEYGKYLRSLN